MQAADMMRIAREGLLAAELRVKGAARLHVPQAKLMKGSRCRAVGSSGGGLETLVGSLGDCPAFGTADGGTYRAIRDKPE